MTASGPSEPKRRRASGRRPRTTGWFPRFGGQNDEPKKPFLPRLPDHSRTGVFARLSEEELRKRGIDPGKARRRRKRLASRLFVALLLRWRYFITSGVALGLTLTLVATLLVFVRDAFNDKDKLPTAAAPTLEELNQSIELGQRFIEALYKPLPNGQAVQSEASGVPLKARFLDENVWVLMGEDESECSGGKDDCQTTTSIESDEIGQDDEKYDISFSTPKRRNALELTVEINWAFSPSQFEIKLTPRAVRQRVEVYLDVNALAVFEVGQRSAVSRTFDKGSQSSLRMLRFTIRHASQEAFLYWSTYGRNPERAAALRKFLESNGFTAGYDMRAPLFDAADTLPDDLPVNDRAYPDCDRTPAGDQFAYAYRSKVCLYQQAYIINGERDPFLQAWAALTVLMKHNNPNRKQPEWGWWSQGDTPKEVSRHLRGQWNRSGQGIPKCTPFSCAELSSIRTSVFGALETQLGYVYGDKDAQRFADAAARVVTSAQVKADGKIRMDDGKTYFRPGQAGSYLGAWTPDLRFTEPSTPRLPVAIALAVRRASPTPLEYEGIIASNSETSLDALGFLMMYRCKKYGVCT